MDIMYNVKHLFVSGLSVSDIRLNVRWIKTKLGVARGLNTTSARVRVSENHTTRQATGE